MLYTSKHLSIEIALNFTASYPIELILVQIASQPLNRIPFAHFIL